MSDTQETGRRIGHEWRVFDEMLGYEVRRDGNRVYVRTRDGGQYTLDLAEFNALRGTGPKPRGLQ